MTAPMPLRLQPSTSTTGENLMFEHSTDDAKETAPYISMRTILLPKGNGFRIP